MAERNPRSISTGGGAGGIGNGGYVKYQEQQADAKHDGAPAGETFSSSELPVIAVPGGAPATLNGYSPDPSRTPQESILQNPRASGHNNPPSGSAR